MLNNYYVESRERDPFSVDFICPMAKEMYAFYAGSVFLVPGRSEPSRHI